MLIKMQSTSLCSCPYTLYVPYLILLVIAQHSLHSNILYNLCILFTVFLHYNESGILKSLFNAVP